ncbi:MAG: NAD(P)-binding domain-containing protein [Lyngbya sp. HA4199-MV5]|jgi:6-phosphogluconate dehydrogenase|nr:NAD(P)-binding domain-containing protein [Lyngbya sp. HA4199-MV5]
MQLGVIGLGRMGVNIVRRLLRNKHECVVFNRTPEKVKQLASEGAIAAYNLDDFIQKLDKPRAIWLMLPAGDSTEQMVKALAEKLDSGDILIDGGNSYYIDDIRRAKNLAQKGIQYLDVGTSGGVWGLELSDIAEVWRWGSVAASWLLDLTAIAMLQQPDLANVKGRISDSGEGRWTI